MTTLSDLDLIEQTLAGHSECFTVLMERHIASVRRCLGAMIRNQSDQEDLTQETLYKIWRYLPSFRSEASFRTWITTIAVNEALKVYRRARVSRIALQHRPLEMMPALDNAPRLEAAETVRSALRKLPAKYRQILILRDLEELSTEETARRLRARVPLVKSRLHRARKMLAQEIVSSQAGRRNRSGSRGDSAKFDIAS